MKKLTLLFFVVFLLFFKNCIAQERAIAITIDDLPFVGEGANFHLNLIIDCIKNNNIPVTGFIIGESAGPKTWPVLERFRDVSKSLGNHTYTHISLDQVDAKTYIEEIARTEHKLQSLLTKPRYFRYPYLAMGHGAKKEAVLDYLSSQNYHVAPITIDSKDFVFNQQLLATPELNRWDFIKELAPVYLDYILIQTLDAEQFNRANHFENRAQILLIHANLLNAYMLFDIIKLYKELGYRFVSLEEALSTFPSPRKKSTVIAPDEIKNVITHENNDSIDTQIETFQSWD